MPRPDLAPTKGPRLAARAVIVEDTRLLLVNAVADPGSSLWCAPGGGVETGASLPDTLIREVFEETGLEIEVGAPCLVNEFHAPERGFHQVEVFFRARVIRGALDAGWRDPEGIVTRRRWVSRAEMATLRIKPDRLARIAFDGGVAYDPLERLINC
jgi:ADP-ribose pyrophosphatase YjhB (NUDIX family)